MEFIYFTITNNCNLKCRHCSQDSEPGGKSIPLKSMEKVIGNFPFTTYGIILSGGEVFTRRKLLYSTIEYIRKRKFREEPEIMVQTNAFWAKDKVTINRTLDELVEIGMTSIEASAADRYHRLAGLDLKKPRLLAQAAEARGIGWKREYISQMTVFPAGRAWSMDSKYWGQCFEHQCKDLNCLGINYEGNVYPCTILLKGMELGNANKEKVVDILSRAGKNENLKILTGKDGPRKLAKRMGLSSKEIKEVLSLTKSGGCGLCSYLFANNITQL